MTYINENDPDMVRWLSYLPITFDRIDSRSIKEVAGDDVREFAQCHFFGGIAGWPLALQLAGWPATEPVWTGSCPCQPFSVAGKRKGVADERHLWPEWLRLIQECRPATIFGEQVASPAGRHWLAAVRADMEALGYEVGAADLCAAGVGAPHIRQRLYWVAHRGGKRRGGDADGLANARHEPSWRPTVPGETESRRTRGESSGCCAAVGLGDAESDGRQQRWSVANRRHTQWSDVKYLPCHDGKFRPVKPGIRLLAHGIPGRVAQLRGLGNAIVPQVAATFVAAAMDVIG